jgi:RNA polymerase sigma-70 factor, ECF subfamily
VDVPPDTPADQALLDRLQAGDRAALEEVVAAHRGWLRRFIDLRMDDRLRARLDASDVIQEAQLEAARRLDDYLRRRPMPLRLWLCKTAYQEFLRLRRQHVGAACRDPSREAPLPDHASTLLARQLLAAGPSPSQEAHATDLARRVHDALARLDETDREVLLLRTFEGLSNHEAAAVLDMESAAVSKRYGRALLRLRQALADGGLTESQV